MIKVGDCLRVQTKTLEDVFGVCYYEVVETGLQAPEKGRQDQKDGIKAVMLGGSGPSAREGLTIIDSQFKIGGEIAAGIIEVMDKEQALRLLRATPKQRPEVLGENTARPPTGVVEID
jgi:hypothetical protein